MVKGRRLTTDERPKIDVGNSIVLKCAALIILIAKTMVDKDVNSCVEQLKAQSEGGYDSGSGASGVPDNKV